VTNHNIITTPGNAPDEADLDVIDEHEEEAIAPVTHEVRLQWFNGLPTTSGKMAIGFHLEAGISSTLDETLVGMGTEQYVVQHKRPDKDGKLAQKTYWALHQCSLIVICRGVLSPFQMRGNFDRLGIAWGLEPVLDDHGQLKYTGKGKVKTQTVLKLRAFVHELYQHGYSEWLPLTLSGYITDELLDALKTQFNVLKAYADYQRAKGREVGAAFYGFSLPIAPASQIKPVGTAPDVGQIYPTISQVPEAIDKEYLVAHRVPIQLRRHISTELLDETINWSIAESQRISQFPSDGEAPALPEGSGDPGTQTRLPAGSSRLPEVYTSWVSQHYCGGDPHRVAAVCEEYHVSDLSQLSRQQYHDLTERWQAEHPQARAS
jgi:hypothetical protein